MKAEKNKVVSLPFTSLLSPFHPVISQVDPFQEKLSLYLLPIILIKLLQSCFSSLSLLKSSSVCFCIHFDYYYLIYLIWVNELSKYFSQHIEKHSQSHGISNERMKDILFFVYYNNRFLYSNIQQNHIILYKMHIPIKDFHYRFCFN